MIEIPEGDFTMGSPSSEAGRQLNEGPQHKVHVRHFYIGKFEVTHAQYEAIRKRPKVRWKMGWPLTTLQAENNGSEIAVEGVSWLWAMEFCERLAKLSGRAYRLPSEAEWEYAARGGTTTPFPWGAGINPELVNYGERPTYQVFRVGSSPNANRFGLFDVVGNVDEWVLDDYHPDYANSPSDGSPWLDHKDRFDIKNNKVLRGGGWGARVEYCRVSSRSKFDARQSASNFGFRVAFSMPED